MLHPQYFRGTLLRKFLRLFRMLALCFGGYTIVKSVRAVTDFGFMGLSPSAFRKA